MLFQDAAPPSPSPAHLAQARRLGRAPQRSRQKAQRGAGAGDAHGSPGAGGAVSRARHAARASSRLELAQPAQLPRARRGALARQRPVRDAHLRVFHPGQSPAPGRRGSRCPGALARHARALHSHRQKAQSHDASRRQGARRSLPRAHLAHAHRGRSASCITCETTAASTGPDGDRPATGWMATRTHLWPHDGVVLPDAHTYLLLRAQAGPHPPC